MTTSTSNERASAWKAFLGRCNNFIGALDMDIHDYQGLRIASLEKRLAKLEADCRAGDPTPTQSRGV